MMNDEIGSRHWKPFTATGQSQDCHWSKPPAADSYHFNQSTVQQLQVRLGHSGAIRKTRTRLWFDVKALWRKYPVVSYDLRHKAKCMCFEKKQNPCKIMISSPERLVKIAVVIFPSPPSQRGLRHASTQLGDVLASNLITSCHISPPIFTFPVSCWDTSR